jgi:hypothetical protein
MTRRAEMIVSRTKNAKEAKVPQVPLFPSEAVKKIKSPCSPPFSKGEMLKREITTVHRKYSIIPLFRVRVPLLRKEGSGEICGVRSGPLQFFHSFPLSKGEFAQRRVFPLFEKHAMSVVEGRARGDFGQVRVSI